MFKVAKIVCLLALVAFVAPANAQVYIHDAVVIGTKDKTIDRDEANAVIAGVAAALGKPGALPDSVTMTVVSDSAIKEIVSAKEYPDAKEAQKSLDDLYFGLLDLKAKQDFFDRGFGPGFKEGNAWKQSALAARGKADNEKVPYQIKNAFSDLIELGDLYLEMRKTPIKTIDELDRRENALFDLRAKVCDALDMTITP